mgnify:CR=1 FL=1
MDDYIQIPDPESDGYINLRTHFIVCPTCKGKGTQMNPSIANAVYTREDFDEDPDFTENYFSNTYDIPCLECRGIRVVPEPDPELNTPEDMEKYRNYIEEKAMLDYEQYQEMRAEGQEVFYDEWYGIY